MHHRAALQSGFAESQFVGAHIGTRSAMIARTQYKGKAAETTMPSFTPVRSRLLQRKCACGGTSGLTGDCEECRRNRLQGKAQNSDTSSQPSIFNSQQSDVPPIVYEVLRSPGQPLDLATRTFMEPRFRHDFSQVRVHTDTRAAESAQMVNALAYTVGRDVVFGTGQDAPQAFEGRRLMAHELTHVVQQANGFQAKLAINQPGDQNEREADGSALEISRGGLSLIYDQTGRPDMHQLMRQQAGKPKTSEPKEDSNVKELQEKVGKLVKVKFKGSYEMAFDYYDANKDKAVSSEEITRLLEDADVGNWMTRSTWVSQILERMDTNKNGKVEWKEFEDGIK